MMSALYSRLVDDVSAEFVVRMEKHMVQLCPREGRCSWTRTLGRAIGAFKGQLLMLCGELQEYVAKRTDPRQQHQQRTAMQRQVLVA